MATYYDDQGLLREDTDPFGGALFYTNPTLDYTPEPGYIDPNRPALPGLTTAQPTQADHELYALLQQAYEGNPDAVLPELQSGNIRVGGQTIWDALQTGQLTDPGLRAYATNVTANQGRTDQFSFLGDNLFPALALFGAAAGGAALYPALAGTTAGAGAGTAAALGNVYGVELAAGGTLAAGAGTSAGGLIVPAAGGAVAAGGAGAGLAAGAGGAGTAGAAGTAAGTAGTVASTGSTLGTLADIVKFAGPAITGATGVIGAVNSGNAARDAAEIQANAARDSNQLLRDIYTQNRADLGPYREAGYQALGSLSGLAAEREAGLTPYQPLDPGQYGFSAPVAPLQASNYQFTGIDPVNAAHYQFQAPVAPVSATAHQFTAPTITDDPGYQFRLEQGQKALERNLAAQGKYLSGAALKELTEYGQGMASQEYGAAYQRALGENQLAYGRDVETNQIAYQRALAENQQLFERGMITNEQAQQRALQINQLAYSRDYTQNQDTYQRALTENQLGYERGATQNQQAYQRQLDAYNAEIANANRQFGQYSTLAQLGSGAAGTTAALGAQAGAAQAENLLGAANANAAGRIGSANAFNQGLSSVGSAAQQYLDYLLLSRGA